MKVDLIENGGCFGITLTPENENEIALLVRFGMNRTDKLNSASTDVFEDGRVESYLVFAKNKNADSSVPKRK